MRSQNIISKATVSSQKSTVLVTFEGNDYTLPQSFKNQNPVKILQLMKKMAANIAENYGKCESFHHIMRNQIYDTIIPKLWEQWSFLHRNLRLFNSIVDATRQYYKEIKNQKSIHKNLYRMFRLDSLKNKYIQDGTMMLIAKSQLEKFETLVGRFLKTIEKVERLIQELHDLIKVTDAVYRKGVDDSFHRSMNSYLNKD